MHHRALRAYTKVAKQKVIDLCYPLPYMARPSFYDALHMAGQSTPSPPSASEAICPYNHRDKWLRPHLGSRV